MINEMNESDDVRSSLIPYYINRRVCVLEEYYKMK